MELLLRHVSTSCELRLSLLDQDHVKQSHSLRHWLEREGGREGEGGTEGGRERPAQNQEAGLALKYVALLI